MGLSKRKGSECWQMRFSLEGKKVRKSTGTSSRRTAQKIYDTVRFHLAQGTYNPRLEPGMAFCDLVNEFLEKHSKVEKESYKRDKVIGDALRQYFGAKPIGSISAYDVKSWRQWRMKHVTRTGQPIKKASVNRELAFMKTMFNMAVEWGRLKENPCQSIKLLRGEEKRLRILNAEEISALISEAAWYLKVVIITAIETGMRKSELLGLRWKHVDFSNGFIRVEHAKNGDARNIPMSLHLKQMLQPLKQGRRQDDFVFVREGKRIICLKEAFKAACERAGIEGFRFHDLRHTAASLLAGGGCDIITLQHILGHKSLSMTQRYAHLIPGRLDRTREIMQRFWQDAVSQAGGTKGTQSGGQAEGRPITH